ncbi:MAG TPA: tetratricopeptide repeat protein [Vicinamibacterales bacterium]|nr:tetratricopeptide repeat protein [Vicinamibacterales bacterium]
MRERIEPSNQYAWIVNAVALIVIGGLAGYIIAMNNSSSRPLVAAPTAAVAPVAAPASSMQTFGEAVDAGNRFYDAQKYDDAIPYYQRALTFNQSDINVSTDLGTALWYTGRIDAALSQYEKSLAIDKNHAQTLFNLGVVRADGKKDYRGAVEAWETLLKTTPNYPQAEKVRSLISDARSKL